MDHDRQNFEHRVSRINRSYAVRVPGKFVLLPDGLIVPRKRSRFRFAFPWKGLLMAFVLSLLLKAFLVWYLGAVAYSDLIIPMFDGSAMDRVAGQILMPDRLTIWLVAQYEVISGMIAAATVG